MSNLEFSDFPWLPKKYHRCHGQLRIHNIFELKPRKYFKSRVAHLFTCKVCQSKKLVKIITDKNDIVTQILIKNAEIIAKELYIIDQELNPEKKHKNKKKDTALGYCYVNGKNCFVEGNVVKHPVFLMNNNIDTLNPYDYSKVLNFQ